MFESDMRHQGCPGKNNQSLEGRSDTPDVQTGGGSAGHVIGDYAALVGKTLITRCLIWCPFDFGFYAIQCRSVRDQNPKNIQKTRLLDSCCGAMQISAKWAKSHFESGASACKHMVLRWRKTAERQGAAASLLRLFRRRWSLSQTALN
jgi:hypothetical protein